MLFLLLLLLLLLLKLLLEKDLLELEDEEGVVVETAESIEVNLESTRELTLLTLFTNRALLHTLFGTTLPAPTGLPYVRE